MVLELVLLPASAAEELEGPPGGPCEAAVLAWGAVVPFSRVAGAGEVAVAEGPMQASCGGVWFALERAGAWWFALRVHFNAATMMA